MGSIPWEGPRRSVEALARRRGRDAVVRRCVDLLADREVEAEVIAALGGPPARWVLDGGAAGPDYWLRVWAVRGLLWLCQSHRSQATLWRPALAQTLVGEADHLLQHAKPG